jgi:hypothetical protein
MEDYVNVYIENDDGKVVLVECPSKTSFIKLKELVKEKNLAKKIKFLYFLIKGSTFDESNKNEIINLEEGDKIIIMNERIDEGGVFTKFHVNINLNESDEERIPLNGILRLILIKHIASNIDANQIESDEIKKIILELQKDIKMKDNPQEDIKTNLEQNDGNNILAYSNYVCSIINDNIIYDLLNHASSKKKNDILKYWSVLSKYEPFNKLFEVELFKAIERSYFDYSLIGLSLYQQTNRKKFIETMEKCPNLVVRYLFHGTQLDPISKIITNGFLYTRKAFYGMGIYFSDMLDYVSFYSGGKNYDSRRDNFGSILEVNDTFSCVSAEVYYNKSKKREIYDYSLFVDELDHFPTYQELKRDYPNQMVENQGIHFARVEPNQGQIRKKEEIEDDIKEGRFIGTEYVITEMDQILPLYGLKFKRNEYFVIWRDNHFKGDNDYSDYLKERKLFIYEIAKMNAYFESSLEKALEIIKRKKSNKIILISNIGLDKAGKKFVEVARKILGFNVMVLFFSANPDHFSWLQEFPNALYTSNEDFYQKYILNYNEKGLLDLKKEVEECYDINLKFEDNFLKFPKFVNFAEYNEIKFNEKSPNFKKVTIKNSKTKSILCMDDNRKPCFKSNSDLDVKKYIWYVTLMNGEITLYSNDSYLGGNVDSKKATGEEFMQRFKYEEIKNNKYTEYLIYYNDKNNVLTVSGNQAILQSVSNNNEYQKFKLIEEIELV